MIRTRFAPSPTGDPHIGNIRSALFAYLFAKKNGGQFLLRIEDTDRERHNESSIEVIKNALNWLGIQPENINEPMIQSERLPIYKEAALKLVQEDKAYICTCSKERLEQVREDQKAKNLPPKYDGHCREQNLEFQDGCVIRMKVPQDGRVKFNDIVRGEVVFPFSAVDDQVILKSDGFPTYHLAHVIDDHEMQISHVIRAEEWLPSTPKHILLNEMLGFEAPQYAHLPVILSPTKGKLSKRDGAVGILEYQKLGYLPEALINFMALLGWNPKTDEEYFTLKELEERFEISQVNKAPAVFDINKLNHFNEHYLKSFDADRLKQLTGIADLSEPEAELLTRGGYANTKEMTDYIAKLRQKPEYDPKLLVFKKSTLESTKLGLEKSRSNLESIENWTDQEIQNAISRAVEENNLSNGDAFWPIRVALSGEERSPSPTELLIALGKDESLKRISQAIELLN